jgi:transcriptional regulator with XRE-family HTH domain
MPTTFASRALRQIKDHLELSQQALARHLEADPAMISRTLRGENDPTTSNFFALVKKANFQVVADKVVPNPEVKYLSMMYAFNTRPKTLTKTFGDWHQFNYFYDLKDTDLIKIGDNPLGAWGIDNSVQTPKYNNTKQRYKVANHLRALLDLLYYQRLPKAKEALADFIGTDEYDLLIFEKVALFKTLPHWAKIDNLMDDHFTTKWRKYKRDHKINLRGFK